MFRRLNSLIVLLILMWGNCSYAQSELIFHVPDFPPYTFEKDNKIQGIGIELVDRILKEAGIQYSLKLVPNYGIAVQDVKTGSSDGFFLASQNAERDKIAVFSNLGVINRWCWFLPAISTLNPKDAIFKTKARVGTFLNTHTHKWLMENGYSVTGSPKIDSLLEMLRISRINVIFLDEAVFLESISKAGEKPESYKKVVQSETHFGIYISKDYLSKNPGVMEKISAAIKKTAPHEN